jgi:hypothetical protein
MDLLNRRIDAGENPGMAKPLPGSQPLVSPEEVDQMAATNPSGVGDPASTQDLDQSIRESPGIVGKTVARLMGSDVNDPLPWTRTGATIAGGVAGGVYGTRVPGPPWVKALGGVAGSVAGTVAGAAAPETTMEALEATGILKPGERERLGLSNSQLMTVLEGEALLDLATMGGVSLLRGGARGISSVLTGANAGTRAMAEGATREGIAMLPVQVGQRQFARGFVSVMGRFPWIAGGLKRRSEEAMGQISRAFDGIPQRLGPLSTFDEVGGRILREAQDTAATISRNYETQFRDLLSRADMNRIQIGPVGTRTVGLQIEKEMAREVPRGFNKAIPHTPGQATDVPMNVPKMHRDLSNFISRTISPLYHGTEMAYQSMRQMDTILKTVDEKMVKYAEAGDSVSMARLDRIRNAIATDMIARQVPQGANNTLSPAQQAIGAEFRRLDQELTEQVDFLFNSTTAQRMGSRISPTIRSAVFTDQGMRGADSLAKTLLRGDSPNAVAEIARLATPDTMQRLGNAYFTEALNGSMRNVGEGVRQFDVDQFERALGLNAPASQKYAQTAAILQHSGGITMDQVQTLADIARRASEAEIPDVSTFIARQATFTGIRGAVRAAIPFATIAGAGGAAGGVGAGLVTGAFMIMGAKGLASMISNPVSARALSRVLDVETRTVVKRAAFARATAGAIGHMLHTGAIDQDQATKLEQGMRAFGIELDNAIKSEQNR